MDRQTAGGSACGGLLVLVIVYIALSFDVLGPTQAGLDFNRIRYQIDDTGDNGDGLHSGGLHWLGVGHAFIKFPLTVQTIEFSKQGGAYNKGGLLRSRTSDGLEVLLEVSMQYQLQFGQILDLYKKFGEEYEAVFVLLAMDTINREATKYDATTFFNNRTKVQEGFTVDMKRIFKDEALCELPFFQLRSVSLPQYFEVAIQTTEVKKQDIKTAEAERFHKQVSGETIVFVAHYVALQIDRSAEAQARTIELDVDAYAEAFAISQGLQSTAFAEVYKALDKNETSLIEYMNVRALNLHPDEKSIVNVKTTQNKPLAK